MGEPRRGDDPFREQLLEAAARVLVRPRCSGAEMLDTVWEPGPPTGTVAMGVDPEAVSSFDRTLQPGLSLLCLQRGIPARDAPAALAAAQPPVPVLEHPRGNA